MSATSGTQSLDTYNLVVDGLIPLRTIVPSRCRATAFLNRFVEQVVGLTPVCKKQLALLNVNIGSQTNFLPKALVMDSNRQHRMIYSLLQMIQSFRPRLSRCFDHLRTLQGSPAAKLAPAAYHEAQYWYFQSPAEYISMISWSRDLYHSYSNFNAEHVPPSSFPIVDTNT